MLASFVAGASYKATPYGASRRNSPHDNCIYVFPLVPILLTHMVQKRFRLSIALVIGLLCTQRSLANMASPLRSGTGSGLPFVSLHVDVRHERINICPSADFKTCRYDVVYDIFADTAGLRIPMLFIAHHYNGGMQVWVDGQAVELKQLPEPYFYRQVSPLTHFQKLDGDSTDSLEVYAVEWEKGSPVNYNQDELHYFEFDLGAGVHQVRVTYTAEVWRDRHFWLADEKFIYALAPARYWHAFGQLDVTLDLRQAPYPVTTNLGLPDSGDIKQVAAWHLDSLPPQDNLEILSVPTPLGYGQIMMDFGMQGFLWTSGALLAMLHLLGMWWWRKRKPQAKFSWIWLLGSLAVPFAAMVVYCLSYEWIMDAIGPAASHYGGYFFLVFIFYPVVVFAYGLATFVVDHLLKRKYRSA
jgi:hypothetical protein